MILKLTGLPFSAFMSLEFSSMGFHTIPENSRPCLIEAAVELNCP